MYSNRCTSVTMSCVRDQAATAPAAVARRTCSPAPGRAAKAASDCSGEVGDVRSRRKKGGNGVFVVGWYISHNVAEDIL